MEQEIKSLKDEIAQLKISEAYLNSIVANFIKWKVVVDIAIEEMTNKKFDDYATEVYQKITDANESEMLSYKNSIS